MSYKTQLSALACEESDAKLSAQLLHAARQEAAAQNESVLLALERLTRWESRELMQAVSLYCGLRRIDLADLERSTPDFASLRYGECLERGCVFLSAVSPEDDAQRQAPVLVTGDPFNVALQNWVSHRIAGYFEFAFAHPADLQAMLARCESHEGAMAQVLRLEQASPSLAASEEISLRTIALDASQVVRLVNSTLYDGHASEASDIHFENTVYGLVIKYRLDGVLSQARQLADHGLAEQVISRLKVMAELDIGEKRIPQDGRFAVHLKGREVDFRVSIMPGLFGEDAVLRILDKQALTAEHTQLRLDLLGIDEAAQQAIRKLSDQPYGMLLVTGPTGSGKTTTLYAALSEINRGEDKIITIEDPVEYQLPGVLQIPVNERKGLGFARGLRAILRHDPDRIFVGEIRDRETAEIAVQAALTGHLVFTSVHANNVFDVITRFRHMGVDDYSFVTALNGVVAQRLVRLVCAQCAADDAPAPEVLVASGLAADALAGFPVRRGRGCAACRNTGFKGRRALTEVLVLNDELRELILRQAPIAQLKTAARGFGMVSMREGALEAVRRGQTTLEEINRVTVVA